MNTFVSEKEKHLKNFLIKKNNNNYTLYLNNFKYGFYGFKTLNTKVLYKKHFENLNKNLLRILKKKGTFIFQKFPFYTITKKPSGLRMGGGKGKVETWYSYITSGSIFLEIESFLTLEQLKSSMYFIYYKFPLKFKIIHIKIDNIFLN